mgnify:CR=1 FL=1
MAQSTLVKRLKVRPGQRVLILNAPPGYTQSPGELPESVTVSEVAGQFGFVHHFDKQHRVHQAWPASDRCCYIRWGAVEANGGHGSEAGVSGVD